MFIAVSAMIVTAADEYAVISMQWQQGSDYSTTNMRWQLHRDNFQPDISQRTVDVPWRVTDPALTWSLSPRIAAQRDVLMPSTVGSSAISWQWRSPYNLRRSVNVAMATTRTRHRQRWSVAVCRPMTLRDASWEMTDEV